MTRAQFATIVVRGLGLPLMNTNTFTDVKAGSWYAPYVGTAYSYGIVNGRTANTFDPEGTITRQEAAAMVARAAKLCGMDTELETYEILNVLAQFFCVAPDISVTSLVGATAGTGLVGSMVT